MITKAQIKYLCCSKWHSAPVYARLDRPFILPQYIIPEGTIVQLVLFKEFNADLIINGRLADGRFPYDAATLLDPPVVPESKGTFASIVAALSSLLTRL